MSIIRVHNQTVQVVHPDTNEYFHCVSTQQAQFLAGIMRNVHRAGYTEGRNAAPQWKWGWLVRKESFWFGVHYSPHNKRWCINLIPCCTFWITKPGGNTP
ncbi:hypothetical protein pXoo2106_17 [Xanthomonas phage pXoo2106]|uniref:Uncharacterized protein n=1 Tax=Xanthomonas phage pXoo2106 TaxID=2970483 RepID=A0AAX3C224_9CAUD|nr:hypothetical protein pXoo2106_17 [Xanthomonas phage pXoo2106]